MDIIGFTIRFSLAGDTTDNPFWDFIRDFLKKPTPEQLACQHPKPILLDTGEVIYGLFILENQHYWDDYNKFIDQLDAFIL